MRVPTRALLATAAVALLATGCNKPKDSCEGTLHSFEGCVNSQDWDCFVELMHPDQRKRYSDKNIIGVFKDNYFGAHSFKFTKINATESANICIAQTLASWTVKVRGKKPVDFNDEYNSFTLHPRDGIWYLDVPGSQKIQGF